MAAVGWQLPGQVLGPGLGQLLRQALRLVLVALLLCSCSARGQGSSYRGPRVQGLVDDQLITIKRGQGAGGSHAWPALRYDVSHHPASSEGMVASFRVRFDKGFEWGCRGKVAGFFVGPGSSQDHRHSPTGASHRLMWSSEGTGYGYVYVPLGTESLQPSQLSENAHIWSAGINWLRDQHIKVRVGKAVYVEIGVKLNSFDRKGRPRADGALLLRIGGSEHVIRRTIMRVSPSHRIQRFVFDVFHGGPCKAKRYSTLRITDATLHQWVGD